VLKLAMRQQALGHDVSILAGCPGHEALTNARSAFSPIRIRPVLISRGFSGPLRGVEFIAKGLAHGIVHRKEMKKCHIVHSHSGYHHLALLASAIGRLSGAPVVHTLYCPVIDEVEEHRSWLLSLKTVGLSLKGIDRIVAISENIRQSLVNCGIDPRSIRVISPGVNTRQFYPGVPRWKWREKLGIPEDGKLILYLGNLVKAKGLDIMIQSLELVAHEVPMIFFAYALQSQHKRFEARRRQYSDALKEIPLAGPAWEFGPVPHIEELMAAADVFVSPLRTTNGLADYPISVMEAMAVGRPVVSTAVGGVKELISHEENGLLAAPGDSEDLARLIVRVLKSPHVAHALGMNARRRIVEQYSMDKYVRETMDLYEEVVRPDAVYTQGENR